MILSKFGDPFWELLSVGLDWLYPPRCPLCGQPDVLLCRLCEAELSMEKIQAIQKKVPGLDWVLASGEHFGPLRDGIRALKYGCITVLARPLAERLWLILRAQGELIDAVLPVPLHEVRHAERGFNQAGLLTGLLSEQAGIPMQAGWLRRQRATRAQVGLNEEQRARNVEEAFQVTGGVREKRLLLVDDVCTSGATLEACARALRDAGAAAIFAITVSTSTY